MFEKEAKDYVDTELEPPVIKPMMEICQECIEIGYNIGKEEQKHNTHTVAHLNDCISEAQKNRINELEAQIEKMKCCFNCKHSRTEYEHCKTDKHEKWEIKEK